MKNLEENCNFQFFGKCLHHWKQKWWKMIKKIKHNDKNMKKMIKQWKKTGKLQFSIFCKIFAPLEAKMIKKW